jgi:uncharacterized membrane protein YbhN (UPF0104 family)
MRRHLRTLLVLALVVALLALFLHNVDLWGVAGEIIHARPEWLAVSLASMFVNLVLRAWRWQYLLEPLGLPPSGMPSARQRSGLPPAVCCPRARASSFARIFWRGTNV